MSGEGLRVFFGFEVFEQGCKRVCRRGFFVSRVSLFRGRDPLKDWPGFGFCFVSQNCRAFEVFREGFLWGLMMQ